MYVLQCKLMRKNGFVGLEFKRTKSDINNVDGKTLHLRVL